VPVFGFNNYNVSDHALPAKTGLLDLLAVPEQQLAAELAVLLPNISNSTVVGTARRVLKLAASFAQLVSQVDVVAVGVRSSHIALLQLQLSASTSLT